MVQTPALLAAFILLFAAVNTACAQPELLTSPYGDLFKDVRAPHTDERKSKDETIVGGIAPHHTLAIHMIENFYERIAASGQKVHRVWLLAPDHFRRSRSLVTTTAADWETNGHAVEADPEGTAALLATGLASDDPFMLEREHAVTIHISALARYFPNARVVPVVPHWRTPTHVLSLLAKALVRNYRPGDLFILSMDFSHDKTPAEAAEEDEKSIGAIKALDWQHTQGQGIDARSACALLLKIARDLGAADAEVLGRTDSFALSGESKDSCTSYASILLKKQVR